MKRPKQAFVAWRASCESLVFFSERLMFVCVNGSLMKSFKPPNETFRFTVAPPPKPPVIFAVVVAVYCRWMTLC